MTHLLSILRCDEVPEPYRSRHGDCHERLAAHLLVAAEAAGLQVRLRVLDVRGGQLPADDDPSELFVTTGSALAPFDDAPWIESMARWVRRAVAGRARIYAICFGHQLVAHALGGQTRRAPLGWEVGCVALSKRFALPPAPAGPATIRMLMSHRDEVSRLPAGALPWLVGDSRPHQGFVIPGRVVTVQGHPEYEPSQAADGYHRRKQVLGLGAYEGALASLAESADGVAISAEILRYFLAAGAPQLPELTQVVH